MTYVVLALLAASAGALFGSVRPAWPWRRPHPVRGTVSFVLTLVAFVVLVGAHLLRWDEGRLARGGVSAGIGLLILVAVWLAPNQPVWTRWTFLLVWGWWMFKVYGLYFAAL